MSAFSHVRPSGAVTQEPEGAAPDGVTWASASDSNAVAQERLRAAASSGGAGRGLDIQVKAGAAEDHGDPGDSGSLAAALQRVWEHNTSWAEDPAADGRRPRSRVTLGPGEFVLETPVQLRSHLTLDGTRGGQGTELRWEGPANQPRVLHGDGLHHITLKDLRLMGKGAGARRKALRKDLKRWLLDNPGETAREFWHTRNDDALDKDTRRMVGIQISGRSMSSGGDDIRLDNVEVRNCGRYGLNLEGADGVEMEEVDACNNGTSRAFDHNLYLRRCENVRIQRGRSTKAAGNGLNLANCEHVRVRGMKANHNGMIGVRVANVEDALLQNVTAQHNGEYGYAMHNEVDNKTRRNGKVRVMNSTSSTTSCGARTSARSPTRGGRTTRAGRSSGAGRSQRDLAYDLRACPTLGHLGPASVRV